MDKGSEKLLQALSDADTKDEMLYILDQVRYICLFRQMSSFVMGFTGTPVRAGDSMNFIEYIIKENDDLDTEKFEKATSAIKRVKQDNSDADIYESISDQEEIIKLGVEYYGYKNQRIDEQ